MIIVTSLSPSHNNANIQQGAAKSWTQYGKCYSLNCESEINALINEEYSGIEFILTDKTIEYFVGKPLVSINAIIDFAKIFNEDLLIINSDILLTKLPEFKPDGITILSRYDYKDVFEDATIFPHGFDVFFIPKQLLKIFPPSIYGLGGSHWDHGLPCHYIENKIPIYYPEGKFAYHKKHPTQYDLKQWERFGEYFRWEFKFPKQMLLGQIATLTMQKILNYSIKY